MGDESRGQRQSPGGRLFIALLPAAAVVGLTLHFALEQPWLGLRLQWDAGAGAARVLSARGPAASLRPGDLVRGVASGGSA
jgi:hypothetical protein